MITIFLFAKQNNNNKYEYIENALRDSNFVPNNAFG